MDYQSETDKKNRRRLLIVGAATVALILILIISIVAVASKKSKSNADKIGSQTSSETISEPGSEGEGEGDDKKTETLTTETKKNEPVAVVSTNPTVDAAPASDMPTTGPEEILPLAMVLGMGAMYASSAVIAKKNA